MSVEYDNEEENQSDRPYIDSDYNADEHSEEEDDDDEGMQDEDKLGEKFSKMENDKIKEHFDHIF